MGLTKRVNALLVVVVFVFVQALIVVSSVRQVSAAVDTCTWTGATSANWATGTNWSGCDNGGVPENGDTLVFPQIASNKTTNNDILNLSVATITINGTGYNLIGNDLTITGVTALTANENAQISTNITYNSGSHVNIYPAAGKNLTITGITTFSVGGGSEVNVGSSSFTGTVTFNGAITGNAGDQLIAQNGAKISVAASANTYTAVNVGSETNGVFECNEASCFGDVGNLIYMGGGVVDIIVSATINNAFVTSVSTPDTSKLTTSQNVSITGNGTIFDALDVEQRTPTASLQFTGAITLNAPINVYGEDTSSNIKFDGTLSSSGNITIYSGNAWMSGSHTFTGTVTVKDGAVAQADQLSSLGATSAPTVIEDGGSLELAFSSAGTIPEPLQIAGSGVSPTAYMGAIYNSGDDTTLTGTITLTGHSQIYNDLAGGTLALEGIISGDYDLTYTGLASAIIEIGGSASNTYSGLSTVSGIELVLNGAGGFNQIPGDLVVDASDNTASVVIQQNNQITDSSNVTLTNGASDNANLVLHVSIQDDINLLFGDGVVSLGAGSKLGISNGSGSGEFSGTITGEDTAMIQKLGPGSWTFSGDNAFSGGGYVNYEIAEGTMSVDNATGLENSILYVSGGTLSGVGDTGQIIVNLGTVAPGYSPGCLTPQGNVALGESATYAVEINGATACAEYDQLTATGAVGIDGATLDINLGYIPTVGTVYTILQGASLSATFAGLPDGSFITIDGVEMRINYTATTVTLTVTSVPLTSGSVSNPHVLAETGINALAVMLIAAVLIVAGSPLVLRLLSFRSPRPTR